MRRRLVVERLHAWMTRRDFLSAALSTAACLGLTGCCSPCSVTHLPRPSGVVDALMIDPHCHIFNAHDLDVFNYISGEITGYWRVSLGVVYAIAEILRAVAPTAEEELAVLDPLISKRTARLKALPKMADAPQVNEQTKLEATGTLEAYEATIDERRRRILDSPGSVKQLQDRWEVRDKAAKSAGLPAADDETTKVARRASARENFEEARLKLLEPRVAAFVDGLWFPRSVNALRLGRVYPEITLFTPAMLDPDAWFQFRPYQPVERSTPLGLQMAVYERVAILTNGRFLPMLAFDPRHQAESANDPESPLELVARALQRKCFVGLKLYPPMGFRPARNAERDASPPPNWPAGLGGRMDAILDTLFERCAQEELPCLAHANRSHASDPMYLDDSRKEFWESALNAHQALRIDLGHFGGMDDASSWRGDFCDLMRAHPGVYADTGDFDGITCAETRVAFFKAIVALDPPVRERLMYGSDFYMNGVYDGYERYHDDWVAAFQDHFPDDWRRLVGGNAADFLGLRAGKQRQRLEEFVQDNRLSPTWLTRL